MDASTRWRPLDPLGEALHFLRMNGAFYCRSELTAPWGMTLPPMPGYLWFHVVTAGRVLLEAGRRRAALLRPGDLALVPHGEGHVLRSEPGVAAPGDPRPRARGRSATATRSSATAGAARRPR